MRQTIQEYRDQMKSQIEWDRRQLIYLSAPTHDVAHLEEKFAFLLEHEELARDIIPMLLEDIQAGRIVVPEPKPTQEDLF